MKTLIVRYAGLTSLPILMPVAMAATFTVTNTNDGGAGSLRNAINQANSDLVAPVKIDFNVPIGLLNPPVAGGVAVIKPQTPLPIIRNIHGHGIIIDGFTQPGSSLSPGNPSTLVVKVELDGSSVIIPAPPLYAHGLHIMSSGNKVQGLCLRSFPHDGISIQGIPLSASGPSGANGNYIQWNLVGTDVNGMAAKPNGYGSGSLWGGIYVKVLPGMPGVANQNQILENVVSGNMIEGVGISNCPDQGSDVQQNHVERCLIGIDITGSGPLGNGHDGVYIGEGAHHNVVEQNWIGANGYEGVGIVGYGPSGLYTHSNTILRNRIGVDVNLNPMPNQRHGVAIGSYGGAVWGFAPSNVIDDNTIAYNGLTGVAVQEDLAVTGDNDTSFNTITVNAIHHNGQVDPGYLGIDLAFEPGVTPNDPGDGDKGANALLNFPVITSAVYSAGTTTVTGTLNIAGVPKNVEVFTAIPGADGSGHGQGAVYLGGTTTFGATWTVVLPGSGLPGQLLTATATDTLGNTSEFSLNVPVWDANQQLVDFGDAPDQPYPTLIASGGPAHQIVAGMFLGMSVDGEANGQPDANATGDDNDGNDDDDGVTFPIPLVPGQPAQIDIVAAMQGRIDAWIDFDGNGTWQPVTEQILSSTIHNGGGMMTSYAFTVPATAVSGTTFARIRYSSGGGLLPSGPGPGGINPDGEVEDHRVMIQQGQEPDEFDFGDAPDGVAAPVYPTLLANNGARHLIVIGGPLLGNAIDPEPDGQPSSAADGDDLNLIYSGVPDDEDGVTFPTALIAGVPTTIQMTSATGGILQGWIDWNGDGDWIDTGEQIITNLTIPAGTTSVPISVPWSATGGANGLTYARFRISSLQGLGFAGPALDGEVEDYLVRLEPLKWLQIPEQGHEGVDVNNTDHMLADDFQCSASGPITDIHIWGSFLSDKLPEVGPGGLTFDISIWSDVPKGPGNPVPFSHPGQQLWQMTFTPGQYSAGHILQVVPGEWWHDPGTQNWLPNADQNIYQFDFYPPKGQAFVQQEGTIYWLAVKYRYQGSSQWTGKFGWKTTPAPWNDDACYQNPASPGGWTDLVYQPPHPWTPDSLNLAFALSGEGPEENIDWGDAPDNLSNPNDYPTWSASKGASHLLGSQFYLGFANAPPDGEPDGQPTNAADGDDLNGAVPDDEGGVTFQSWLIPGSFAAIKVDVVTPAGVPGYLNGWIDFNRNGNWADPGEHFIVDAPHVAGPAVIGFAVPPGALPGPTYARFRFTSQTLASLGLNEGGQAPDGEVEDYRVDILAAPHGVDFGDALDAPYPTLIVNGGAHHIIMPGYHMGKWIDAEPDGQSTSNADGDDLNPPPGPDDEDGVYFYPLIIGQQGAIDVSVTGNGFIDAWIDCNANGSWLDAGEQIAVSVAVTPGLNQIVFNLPAGTVTRPACARVRFSMAGGLPPTGGAQDGEVEDYQLNIRPEGDLAYDFGDAPDPFYPTLAASNGARHLLMAGTLWLGVVVDPEPDGQATANADGDDLNPPPGPDDEDGVSFAYALIGGKSSLMQVIASAPGFIDMWIDCNANGSWADLGDNVLSGYPVTPGVNYVMIAVPTLTYTGPTIMRVRISSNGYLPPTGFAPDGEVEDYELFLYEEGGMDFGDAPNMSLVPPSGFPTTMMDLGAAHFIDSLFLGWLIDSETDGQPSLSATGDDSSGLADEDGVTFSSPWISSSNTQFSVMVSPAALGAFELDLWVDWNGDGTWTQANEHVLVTKPVVPGPNAFTIPVPAGLGPVKTYARFRLTHAGTGTGIGGFVYGGEVEDYLVPIGKKIQAGIQIDRTTTPPNAVLNWTAEPGAASYSVYSSTTLAGPFPSAWTLESSGIVGLTWNQAITGPRKFFIVVAFP